MLTGRIIEALRTRPALHRFIWKSRSGYNRLRRNFRVGRPIVDGAPLIEQAIREARPFAAGKIGSVEALALKTYLRREKARRRGRKPPPYSARNFEGLYLNAGVFPRDAQVYDRFCAALLRDLRDCDALAAWDVAGEVEVLSREGMNQSLVALRDLEPFWCDPWQASACW